MAQLRWRFLPLPMFTTHFDTFENLKNEIVSHFISLSLSLSLRLHAVK